MTPTSLTRREFGAILASTAATAVFPRSLCAVEDAEFRLRYIVASCMYGEAPLAEILPEVRKTGADYVEIWAKRHGNQREQIDELGVEQTRQLLDEHHVELGSFTCFKYGIFNMQEEMRLVKQLGGDMVICNTGGPKNLEGEELKSSVNEFAEKLKPHVDVAEELGITIGIENHSGGLISSPDSQRQVMDALPSKHLGIAMAPYHLPQDTDIISGLIRDLGERLVHIQAWEHGMGCMEKLPKEQELMQLPHRGPLDWVPILSALKDINYQGRTEIFMHPVPRGIPILDTTEAVTAEINAARSYLEECLAKV
ncbi:MAG: sugar phosphate isomerase/epimerase [Planctomycetaceae bacterium]|nr:sugar phosphate isomerase/epimerase [Planctomycetaceae bacterium]